MSELGQRLSLTGTAGPICYALYKIKPPKEKWTASLAALPCGRGSTRLSLISVIKDLRRSGVLQVWEKVSLVLLFDLPLALFFLYVISMIAGPLAWIGLVALPVVIVAGVVMPPFLSGFTRLSQQYAIAKQAILVEILSGLETARVTGAGALMKTRYLAALRGQLDTGVSSRTCGQLRVNFSMSVQQHAQVCAVVLVVFW